MREEESKLHVRVDEAEILRSRLKEMADWSEGALKLLSDASAAVQEFQGLVAARVAEGGLNSQDERAQKALAYGIKMSAALANGEALGLELEEEGRKMKECLWVLGVGKLLAADAQRQVSCPDHVSCGAIEMLLLWRAGANHGQTSDIIS